MFQSRLIALVRAGEWWEYKLVPIVTAFYATAFLLRVPVSDLWPAATVLLLALVPGAAWVSLINDLTDREDDRRAGKPNRLATASIGLAVALLAVTMGAGAFFVVLWWPDSLLAAFYLAAWISFGLYSLPPFRWKTRGFAGVIADAAGAHLFPTLVAVTLAVRAAEGQILPLWLAASASWSLGYGMRGILWHQLGDADADRAANVRTFVERHSSRSAVAVGTLLSLPLEILGMTVMLWLANSPLLLLTLPVYALLVVGRAVVRNQPVVVVNPRENGQVILQEYYDVFLPLGILLLSSMRHPSDLIVVVVHLLVFPRRAGHALLTAVRILTQKRYSRA